MHNSLFNQICADVETGMSLELPNGTFASIRPRSGLSTKGVILPNSPGTIDSDYRREIKGNKNYGRNFYKFSHVKIF